jgi:hypothetical protein
MIFAISDFKGGIDGILGIVVFQPIMSIIFAFLTIFIYGLIGLPIRINKKLNEWWRTKFYISIILTFIGIILSIISFLPNFVQKTEYEINGILETVTIPNIFLAITGWFLIAFGILHSFPPFKLQIKITDWLNRKISNKKTKINSELNRT